MREFIDEKAGDFVNLDVRYKQGQKPQLVMIDADLEEKVPVGGWNVDTMVDYLNENLILE